MKIIRNLTVLVLLGAVSISPTSAGSITKNSLLRYAYLAKTPYFLNSGTTLSQLKPKETEILSHLIPNARSPQFIGAKTIQRLEVLTENPVTVVVALTRDVESVNEPGIDVIFGIRGSANLNDLLVDLSAFAIYGKNRIKQGFQFNRDSLLDIAPPNPLEELFDYLPDCEWSADKNEDSQSSLQTSRLSNIQSQSDVNQIFNSFRKAPQLFIHSVLRDRLISQYVRPIETSVRQYLTSPDLKKRLGRMPSKKINRVILVGHSLGGFLARVIALNYSNRIAGFNSASFPDDLPEQAESVGFCVPGLSFSDYSNLAPLMDPDLKNPDLLSAFVKTHHLTIGHTQDLIFSMGNVRSQGESDDTRLVLEPDGSSLIIPLPKEWFDTLSEPNLSDEKIFSASDTRAIDQLLGRMAEFYKEKTPDSLSELPTAALEKVTGLSPKHWAPHRMSAIIESLERLEQPDTPLAVYPSENSER